MPRLSALICSYNHEAYIGATIQSVLDQSRGADEILVWDDGSTDGTVQVARQFEPDVQVISAPHAGVVEARNRAILKSSGDLVAIIDSDDLIEPDRFERQVPEFEKDRAIGLCYGDCWIVDSEARRRGRFSETYPTRRGVPAAELFARYCFIPAMTAMFRRTAFDAAGPLWGPGPHTDYLKWIEIALIAPVVRIPGSPLGSWRRHRRQTSSGDAHHQETYYLSLKQSLHRLWRRSPELRSVLSRHRYRRRLAMCHFMISIHALRGTDFSLAETHFRRAARLAPRDPLAFAGRLASLPYIRSAALPLAAWAANRRFRRWE